MSDIEDEDLGERMFWNYRILNRGGYFQIMECFYEDDEPDKVRSYIDRTACPSGETKCELLADLKAMMDAFKRPILTETDLPGDE